MYEQFFGLRARPFSLTPDPAYLYMGRSHRFALTLLDYALQQGCGFALVSGEVGSGKTTIIQYVLRRLEQDMRVGLLTNVHAQMGALLPWVLQSLRVKPAQQGASELYDAFVRYLEAEHAAGRRVVLIIDEAQNLSAAALEELRVLSNVNSSVAQLLQTILVGQPELRTTLKDRSMRQLAQRIAIDYHIPPLERAETHAYIRHRLTVAGGAPDLIDPEAREVVHANSGGVPRLINQICDTALVYAYSEQCYCVEPQLVHQVVRDRGGTGVLPLGAAALPAGGLVIAD